MQTIHEKVLVVDDEPNFVTTLQAYLSSKNFAVETAFSANEAILRLAHNEIAVVVADQRMPGTKGVDLLSQIQKDYPDVIRVLITGYSDVNVVVDAVNRGAIYRYLSKRAQPEEIAAVVGQCVDKFRQDEAIRKLSRANQRLLRMLAAEQNLSALGIFGKEVAEKLESIVMGLSSYLFGRAGENDPKKLERQFRHLETAIRRIREFSLSFDGDSAVTKSSDLSVLIEEELVRARKAAENFGDGAVILSELDPRLPALPVSPVFFKRVMKELLENALLFNAANPGKVFVKSRICDDLEDPRVEIEIRQPVAGVQEKEVASFFAPFYTSLGQIDVKTPAVNLPFDAYNLGKGHHYGIGLALARWLACHMGGEVAMAVKGSDMMTQLTLPTSCEEEASL